MQQINYKIINNESLIQFEKENCIANMLIHTLYLNQINKSECYRIIKLFKEKVLNNVVL